MNRRSFIGLVLGAAAAITFRAAKSVDLTIDSDLATLQDWYRKKNALGEQLSYITRRAYLAPAFAQIYSVSPLLISFPDETAEES